MKLIQKGLAGVFAFLFILSAFASLLLYNLEQNAFDPGLYQEVFADQQFYEQLPAILGQAVFSSTIQEQLPSAFKSLTSQNWENFIRALLPPETLHAMGDDALRSIFAYLAYQSENAEISLLPVKTQLTSEAGVQAVADILRSQPDCTLAQLAQLTISLLNGNQYFLCKPPEELIIMITPAIQAQLSLVAQTLPDSALIFDPSEYAEITDLRASIKKARFFMRLSPLLPVIFLFLMTLLIVRSLHDWLTWWGIPLLMTGVLTILVCTVGSPLLGSRVFKIIEGYLPNFLPPVLFEQSQELAVAILARLIESVQMQALIPTGVGFIMILAALALRRFSRRSAR